MKPRVWPARLFLSTFLQHYKWPSPVFKTPATPPEHLCAPALSDIYIHTSAVVLEGISFFLFPFFKAISASMVQLCHVVLCGSPQSRWYSLRTVSALITLFSVRQAKHKASVFYCCVVSFGESPIVSLNNWDQRICLLYFFPLVSN